MTSRELGAAIKKGKRRAAKARRLAAQNGHPNPLANGTAKGSKKVPAQIFAYAQGYIECWVHTFAASAGVSGEALASQLGEVLSGKGLR